MLHPLPDVIGVAAHNGEADPGVPLPERDDQPGEAAAGAEFPAADGNLAGELLPLLAEVQPGLFGEGEELLRPALEQKPVLGERDAAVAAGEQADAQLLLELCNLPGEGRLGEVERGRGLCYAPFSRNCQKVMQHPQFHFRFLPFRWF